MLYTLFLVEPMDCSHIRIFFNNQYDTILKFATDLKLTSLKNIVYRYFQGIAMTVFDVNVKSELDVQTMTINSMSLFDMFLADVLENRSS